jgi:hypothetical protein
MFGTLDPDKQVRVELRVAVLFQNRVGDMYPRGWITSYPEIRDRIPSLRLPKIALNPLSLGRGISECAAETSVRGMIT